MLENIPLLTYGVAAAAFLVLSILLMAQWHVRPLGPSLLAATLSTAAWAAAVAVGTLADYPPITLLHCFELLRDATWMFFLLQILGLQESGRAREWLGRRWLPYFVVGLCTAVGIVLLGRISSSVDLIQAKDAADAVVALWLSLAITGLLLVEQLYRNAREEERWGIKFLCLGLGVIFAYDLFMYAEALLFRQLNAQLWQARGVISAMVVPWLAVAIARNRNWSMDVHVSRHVVFHTVTLMGAGVYLLGMAVIGYFIKFLGGSWGGVLQISFLAASGALLFTLLFSGTLRSRLRVYLSKNFFSYRYDYRVEWLKFTEGLAQLDDAPNGIISAMAPIALSPGGFILHKDSNGKLEATASWELDTPTDMPLSNLPEWITNRGWVIDLREWKNSPDLYAGLELPEWLEKHKSLWLIVPLFFQQSLEGLLFLARTDLKDSVNWEDRDLLKTAGQQAAALLAQQRASAALVESRQFDAFNRLSAYVIHDLKNILAQQSLIVSNARKHRDNPAFIDDMIGTVENSVKRMQRLMDQMRSGLRTTDPKRVNIEELLKEVCKNRGFNNPIPELNSLECWVMADRERLATVFGHVVQNAQEATGDDGSVRVNVQALPEKVIVAIEDNGCGMSKTFVRERLFKPFESTKGLTGMGIGAFESREYIRQLGGDIAVESQEGSGTLFTISLPPAPEETPGL